MTMADSDFTNNPHEPRDDMPSIVRNPAAVVLAGWLLPGGGYLLLGEVSRGLVIGISVISMFVLGLLIGGVRVLEVPFFDHQGKGLVDETIGHELRAKPWSMAQVMTGPIAILSGAASVRASVPGPDGTSLGAESHARLNDIAVLYTAVAGMLNLLAIIDSGHRAAQPQETP